MNKIMTYTEATETLSRRGKVGQFFMPAAFINDSEEEIQKLEELIQKHTIGGLCFFHSRASAATNYEKDSKGLKATKIPYNKNSLETLKTLIKRYQAVAKYPLLISMDAEWGLAMRVENMSQYPYAITLGAIQDNDDLIFKVGRNIAWDCKEAGIHWNLAPVVDINNNPENPVIGYRSLGENKDLVLQKARAFIKGTQSEGVLTSIKHFPGHGDTATDSHLGLPLIDKSKQELFENELYPFQKLIDEGVDSVMVGHLSVPNLANGERISSSISKDIIKGLLRYKMGFQGVVISDALNMHAVSKDYPTKGELEWLAFDAGNDILCFSEHPKEGIRTILKKANSQNIEESFKRIWKLKEKAFQAQTQVSSSNSKIDSTGDLSTNNRCNDLSLKYLDHTELNTKLAGQSLTLLKGTQNIVSNFGKDSFFGIEISQNNGNHFFTSIQDHKKFQWISSQDHSIPYMADQVDRKKNILISLYPPQVKPTNSFGISNEELQFINTLIQKKNTLLYLFGNPYALNHIDVQNAKAIVVGYQDFQEFQEVAAQHFLGVVKANGTIPVTLKRWV